MSEMFEVFLNQTNLIEFFMSKEKSHFQNEKDKVEDNLHQPESDQNNRLVVEYIVNDGETKLK